MEYPKSWDLNPPEYGTPEYSEMMHHIRNHQTHTLEVTTYRINGKGCIEIDKIKVLDSNGKYVKFAKLKEVIKHLPNFHVVWKEQTK
jgi:archaellum component FlaF (FlaF/FlaG flagellin family)